MERDILYSFFRPLLTSSFLLVFLLTLFFSRYSAECLKQHFPDADLKPKGTSNKP